MEQYQKKGKQGPWTDIYALGSTVYNALTGEVPEDPMSRMSDDTDYQSNKYEISDNLWALIRKATMLNIEDRYQNVQELRDALKEIGIAPVGFDALDACIQNENSVGESFDNHLQDNNATTLLSDDPAVFDNNTIAISNKDTISALGAATPEIYSFETVYEEAKRNYQSNKVDAIEKSIKQFRSLGDYKDSMKLLSEARRKLRNVRNSKRRVRILLLTCASVLILFAIITSVVIIHNQQGMKISKEEESRDSEYFNDPIYQEGLSAIKAGEFRKAIRIFESLDDACFAVLDLNALSVFTVHPDRNIRHITKNSNVPLFILVPPPRSFSIVYNYELNYRGKQFITNEERLCKKPAGRKILAGF